MTINAYPLAWPAGWKRVTARKSAKFSTRDYSDRRGRQLSVADGLSRVLAELERIGRGRDDVVVSTNVELRLDGFPRSGRGEPSDPGVAVYWRTLKGEHKVMAIDLYDRVADNLAAVAATLDAMRAIERHGGAAILDRAFTGFTALPAPSAAREWWDVLQCRPDASSEVIKAQYRRLRSETHPDRPGGSAAALTRSSRRIGKQPMAEDERFFLHCAAGCKRTAEVLRDRDGMQIYPPGWSQLQITSDRWRCPTCERELRAANGIIGSDAVSGDALPPHSRGALPRETASTIAAPALKG